MYRIDESETQWIKYAKSEKKYPVFSRIRLEEADEHLMEIAHSVDWAGSLA